MSDRLEELRAVLCVVEGFRGHKLIAERGVVKWVNSDGTPADRGMRSAGDPFPIHAKFFADQDAEAYVALLEAIKAKDALTTRG